MFPIIQEDFTQLCLHHSRLLTSEAVARAGMKASEGSSVQVCVDSLSKKEVSKVQGSLLPVVAQAANDPAPDVREANMGVLVSFAIKSGNMGLLEKVTFKTAASASTLTYIECQQ